MADREKQQRDDRETSTQVGRDIPDESKEHHTEIAVEAGKRANRPARQKRQGDQRGQYQAPRDIPDESKEHHTEIAVESGEELREEHEHHKR